MQNCFIFSDSKCKPMSSFCWRFMKYVEVYFKSIPADEHKLVYMLRKWSFQIVPDIRVDTNGLVNLDLNKFQKGFLILMIN